VSAAMNDPWAAAWTATVYVAITITLFGAVWGLFFSFWLVVEAVGWLVQHLRGWQVGAVLLTAVCVFVWVVIFLSAWCCGVPVV
jgi:hypothetical protein